MATAGWVLDSLVGLLSSPPWKCLVENFVDQNCLVFDNQDLSQFAYTEVHQRYQKLVEGQLEIFMGHLGISAEQFLAATTVATAPTSVHKALFVQVQAAEDYVVFKEMMMRRNLELNQQAMAVLQQRSPPPDTSHDVTVSSAESKEKEAEEEELLEALRRSKEEFEEGLSRGLSVEEREMEEDELQQALRRSMEEYKQSTEQPPPSTPEGQGTSHESPSSTQTSQPGASSQPPGQSSHPPAGQSSHPPGPSPPGASSQPPGPSPPGASSHPPGPSPPGASSHPPGPPRLPLLPAVSAPPAVRTGADAAAEWLASARAEAGNTASLTPVSQSLGEIDIKQRQAYLRKQRDELVTRNQRQRKKDLDTYTAATGSTPTAAAGSPTHQSEPSVGTSKQQQPVLCSALANKLSNK